MALLVYLMEAGTALLLYVCKAVAYWAIPLPGSWLLENTLTPTSFKTVAYRDTTLQDGR